MGDFFAKKSRRAKEKLLESIGKADRTVDESYEQHAALFLQQQKAADRVQRECRNYAAALKTMSQAARGLADAVRAVYEPDWSNCTHVAAMTETIEKLWADVGGKVAEEVEPQLNNYAARFADPLKKMAKRDRKLVDFDGARHALFTQQQQANKKPDEAKIQKASKALTDAQGLYESLNSELNETLPALYAEYAELVVSATRVSSRRTQVYARSFQALFDIEHKFHRDLTTLHSDLSGLMDELAASAPPPPPPPPPPPAAVVDGEAERPSEDGSGDAPSSPPLQPPPKSPPSQPPPTSPPPSEPTNKETPLTNGAPEMACESPPPVAQPRTLYPAITSEAESTAAETETPVDSSVEDSVVVAAAEPVVECRRRSSDTVDEEASQVEAVVGARPAPLTQARPSLSELVVDPPSPMVDRKMEETAAAVEESDEKVTNSSDGPIEAANQVAPTEPLVVGDGGESLITVRKVRATHRYTAEDGDEISFEAGEVIRVIPFEDPDEQDDGWLKGVKESSGDKGVFPANFTKPL